MLTKGIYENPEFRWKHAHDLSEMPISPEQQTIVYDPHHKRDSAFVKVWARASYPDAREVHVGMSGHKTAIRLQEVGKLKDLVLDVLEGRDVPPSIDGFPEGSAKIFISSLRTALADKDMVAARQAAAALVQSAPTPVGLQISLKTAITLRDKDLAQDIVDAVINSGLQEDDRAKSVLALGRKFGVTPGMDAMRN